MAKTKLNINVTMVYEGVVSALPIRPRIYRLFCFESFKAYLLVLCFPLRNYNIIRMEIRMAESSKGMAQSTDQFLHTTL